MLFGFHELFFFFLHKSKELLSVFLFSLFSVKFGKQETNYLFLEHFILHFS